MLIKFFIKIIFVSSLLSIFSFPQNIRIKLEEIKNPSDNVIRVLSGNSLNDFWVNDANGNLYHFFENRWKKFDGPQGFISNTSIITPDSDSNFLMMLWDKEWRTHFFKFTGKSWLKLPFIHPYPIQKFIKYNNKVNYIIGNFGSLLKYERDSITIIKTPIEEHLISAVAESKDVVWIGTQGNGIFRYDGKNFKPYKIKDQAKTWISAIWISEKKNIYVQTHHNEIYTLKNDTFIQVDNSNDSIPHLPDKFGFILYTSNDQKYPSTSFYIPKEKDISSICRLKDNTYIFSSTSGKLFTGKECNQLFFYDLASSFGVAGDARNQVLTAAFRDLNGDNQPELFMLNFDYTKSLKVFLNEKDHKFTEITALTGLNSLAEKSASFYVTDINEDGKLDIVFVNLIDGRCQLLTTELKNDYFFSLKQIIDFSPVYNVVAPINIRFTDFDLDGDLDLNIVRYYGDDLLHGSSFFLENKSWGNFVLAGKKFNDLDSCNTQSIFADFDGNGKNDWFVSNKWRKDQLLLNRNGRWAATNFSNLTFDTLKYMNTVGSTTIDYDVDGDLDLLLITEEQTIRILKNDGKANFSDVTDSLIPPAIFEEGIKAEFKHILNTADFNNDGYPDIFLTIFNHRLSQNFLLLNRNALYFEDVTEFAGVKLPYSSGVICADVDDDGDIDIFGFGNGLNNLWINMTNDNNYFKIVPKGVYSNRTGVGVKIWIYDSGHFNDQAYLRGYTQTGTIDFGNNQINDDVVHFGISAAKKYDLKIQFQGGTIKRLENIRPGKTLIVSETNEITAFIYLLPGNIFRYLRQEEVIFYIISFLLGMGIIFGGIKFGYKKFKWDTKLTVMLIGVNVTIFWILILLSSDSLFVLKYFLPVGVVSAGILLPNLIYFRLQKNVSKNISQAELHDKLFQLLINFTHGEWALRNLNSLQLLCQNVPQNTNDESFLKQFEERRATFRKMTLPAIDNILVYCAYMNLDKVFTSELTRIHSYLKKIFIEENLLVSKTEYEAAADSIKELKLKLRELKVGIFSIFSSDPVEVIRSVCDSVVRTFEEKNIIIEKLKQYRKNIPVLIKGYELADIIDNCINNATRAIDIFPGKITISLIQFAPKILIEIEDNGKGISNENFEKIFERGYSSEKSTGHGLYLARESLKKYGGRIYLKESQPGKTIIVIELNEGIYNEASPVVN